MKTRYTIADGDRLEAQVRMLQEQIASMRVAPGDSPLVSCCDHCCVVAARTGMGTNGGCQCDERKLRRAVMWWRRVAEYRQVTIQEMREAREVQT